MAKFLNKKQEDCIVERFIQSLTEGRSISDILFRFVNNISFKECHSNQIIPEDIRFMLTNAVMNYNNLITNSAYKDDFRDKFNEVFDKINSISSDFPNLQFKLEGRRKSVVSSIEKLIKLLKQGRSLDLFRDTFGIRLVLMSTEDTEAEKQKELYSIANVIIKFLIEQGNILCESENMPKKETLEKGVGKIVIPKKSYISPMYSRCIKDYVALPKSNGYQAIHMVFRSPKGYYFEVQLRTENMHIRAEYLYANHTKYKLTEYTLSENEDRLLDKIDLSKINMPGFRYLGLKEKTFTDYKGLVESIRIYFRDFP